jgi:hypothetical protein
LRSAISGPNLTQSHRRQPRWRAAIAGGVCFILAHPYQGTQLGTTNPAQTVRVLLADGTAQFAGATRAANTSLSAGTTYDVSALAGESLRLVTSSGRVVGRFAAPLTVTGPGSVSVPGLSSYCGSLELRPDGAGGV